LKFEQARLVKVRWEGRDRCRLVFRGIRLDRTI